MEELYNNYKKDVYFYILSLCKNPSLSEDLTSETFYQIMLSLSSFKKESDIKTWIFSIARNVTYKELRKRRKEINTEQIPEHPFFDEYGYKVDEIMELIKDKPKIQQEIFQLRLEGYSYEEISMKVNMNPNSIRVMYFRIKNELKKQLERGDFYE